MSDNNLNLLTSVSCTYYLIRNLFTIYDYHFLRRDTMYPGRQMLMIGETVPTLTVWFLCTRLQGDTSHKTVTSTVTGIRTTNLSYIRLLSFAEYNQQDAMFHNFFISVRRSAMFEMVFLSIIRSSKLHIKRQVFVRRIPDAVCAVLSS